MQGLLIKTKEAHAALDNATEIYRDLSFDCSGRHVNEGAWWVVSKCCCGEGGLLSTGNGTENHGTQSEELPGSHCFEVSANRNQKQRWKVPQR